MIMLRKISKKLRKCLVGYHPRLGSQSMMICTECSNAFKAPFWAVCVGGPAEWRLAQPATHRAPPRGRPARGRSAASAEPPGRCRRPGRPCRRGGPRGGRPAPPAGAAAPPAPACGAHHPRCLTFPVTDERCLGLRADVRATLGNSGRVDEIEYYDWSHPSVVLVFRAGYSTVMSILVLLTSSKDIPTFLQWLVRRGSFIWGVLLQERRHPGGGSTRKPLQASCDGSFVGNTLSHSCRTARASSTDQLAGPRCFVNRAALKIYRRRDGSASGFGSPVGGKSLHTCILPMTCLPKKFMFINVCHGWCMAGRSFTCGPGPPRSPRPDRRSRPRCRPRPHRRPRASRHRCPRLGCRPAPGCRLGGGRASAPAPPPAGPLWSPAAPLPPAQSGTNLAARACGLTEIFLTPAGPMPGSKCLNGLHDKGNMPRATQSPTSSCVAEEMMNRFEYFPSTHIAFAAMLGVQIGSVRVLTDLRLAALAAAMYWRLRCLVAG